jgi:hypothetical protein
MLPYTAISAYTFCGLLLYVPEEQKLSPVVRSSLGAISSVVGTISTHPLDVVRARLVAQAPSPAELGVTTVAQAPYYRGITHALSRIAEEEGVRGLCKGLSPALLAVVPFAVLYSGVYVEVLKRLDGHVPYPLGLWKVVMAGTAAGTVAGVATHPLEVVRRQMELQHTGFQQAEGVVTVQTTPQGQQPLVAVEQRQAGIVRTGRAIVQQAGWRALFSGLQISFYKTVPMLSITLLTREEMLAFLRRP